MNEKIIFRKYADVGTGSPFLARCMPGMMKLRDAYFGADKNRTRIEEFDSLYYPVWTNILSAFEKKKKIEELIEGYSKDFKKKNFRSNGSGIEFDKDIDKELNNLYKGYILDIHTAVKDVQKVTKYIGFDIGFFYGENPTFEKGILIFLEKHKQGAKLVDSLKMDREWYSALNKIRGGYMHKGFNLPGVKYDFEKYEVLYPAELFDISSVFENSWTFVEYVMVSCFDMSLTDGMRIMEIPENKRNPLYPIKYVIGIPGINF